MTLWMMEEEFEIGGETVLKRLVENLGKQKICPRFVPHSLLYKMTLNLLFEHKTSQNIIKKHL
jgi:hypothetical protein